jgi:hypothetical protein
MATREVKSPINARGNRGPGSPVNRGESPGAFSNPGNRQYGKYVANAKGTLRRGDTGQSRRQAEPGE